ncbi:MAG TPA: adenosylcobalamin-dependent ribonucleoside-diphosphate reductase [Sedimentisphaerales bacterium]|jgi:ribonucleoside-diphosphate reductase alpha chain|nr:adenosylcobalamin-dependent ribonucleoside-diphosphate reductase [Sedimentisphaerales bacterium]HNU30634.1 adenosylcobalamin-dependent ribonucleoside-diphosphate reductase [Sedimentisphaerales bacterium]
MRMTRMAVETVRKRDGLIVEFDASKIERAVQRAAMETLQDREQAAAVARRVTRLVTNDLAGRYAGRIPGVEDIQDLIEAALMAEGYSGIARGYILYRETRSQVRFAKSALGLKDDLKLPVNAIEVLRRRYLLKDESRRIVETPSEMFRRVAHHVAQAEAGYGSGSRVQEAEEVFYRMMRSREFLPNSPTLMNAGTPLGQLCACFVLPVEDSVEGIFKALADMARIHQTGGGTGFSFSRLRPRGDLVGSTMGRASGPISFLGIFDKATEVIVQGGRRRGANMGVLRCDHPDIVDFIEAKVGSNALRNFNLSVGVTDPFMRAVARNRPFDLVNPRTGKSVARVGARSLFDLIVNAAWRTGDPGVLFLDQVNRRNPTPGLGRIEATNPCGEVPLLPHESCILASINLDRMTTDDDTAGCTGNAGVDWARLRDRVHWGVRFLDDVIDVNCYPLESIALATRANRKIGLGVMGFADMLIRLGIPYGAPEAVAFADKLMRFIRRESLAASESLARRRGVFPHFRRSIYAGTGRRLRNATVNTIAPTGTISIIAGCSSGIEPLFAVSFVRNVLSGTRLFESHPLFEKVARERGFYRRDLAAEVARRPSLAKVRGVPRDVKRLFATAFDVTPRQHLEIQAAFQRHTDNAVSKTINLPADATVEDVREIYLAAHRLRCKGITVYRYGSKADQVLSVGEDTEASPSEAPDFIRADLDYSGVCPSGVCEF